MKTKAVLFKYLFLLICLILFLNSQVLSQVSLNTTGNPPNSSAALDIDFSNKGLLIPRVALQNNTDASTISNPANSLIVYNTGSGGLIPAGYYYNAGTTVSPNWVRLLITGVPSDAWLTLGNAGINPSTHFLGTTDNQPLIFKTNSLERMRITNAGNIGIGTTSPNNGAILHVSNSNKGVMLPQVSLTGATDNSTVPVSSPASDGMLVYNISTTGSGSNAVTPGYYYWQSNRWKKVQTSGYAGAVFGTYAPAPNHLTTLAPGAQYLNAQITLPPGKWIVYIYSLLSPYNPNLGNNTWDVNTFAGVWCRLTLSESNTTFSISPDIQGGTLASGALNYPSSFGLATGAIVVHNTSTNPKTYYVWGNISIFGTNCGLYNILTAGWGENNFFAIPAE